jgi:hypothetical protein
VKIKKIESNLDKINRIQPQPLAPAVIQQLPQQDINLDQIDSWLFKPVNNDRT